MDDALSAGKPGPQFPGHAGDDEAPLRGAT